MFVFNRKVAMTLRNSHFICLYFTAKFLIINRFILFLEF
jgi:hypothetical protein